MCKKILMGTGFIILSASIISLVPLVCFFILKNTWTLTYSPGDGTQRFMPMSENNIFEGIVIILIVFWIMWIYQLTLFSIKILKLNSHRSNEEKNYELKLRGFIYRNSNHFKKSAWTLLLPSILIFLLLSVSSSKIKNDLYQTKVVARSTYSLSLITQKQSLGDSGVFKLYTPLTSSSQDTYNIVPDKPLNQTQGHQALGNIYQKSLEFIGSGLGGIFLSEIIRKVHLRQMKTRKFGESPVIPDEILRQFGGKLVSNNVNLYKRISAVFDVINETTCLSEFLKSVLYFEIEATHAVFYLSDDYSQTFTTHCTALKHELQTNRITIDVDDTDKLGQSKSWTVTLSELNLAFVCLQNSTDKNIFINIFCKQRINIYGNLDEDFISSFIFDCATSSLCSGIEEINFVDCPYAIDKFSDFLNITGLKVNCLSYEPDLSTQLIKKVTGENSAVIIFIPSQIIEGNYKYAENHSFLMEHVSSSNPRFNLSGVDINSIASHCVLFHSGLNEDLSIKSEKSEVCSQNLNKSVNSTIEVSVPLKISQTDLLNIFDLFDNLSRSISSDKFQGNKIDETELLLMEGDNRYFGKTADLEEKTFDNLTIDFFGLKNGEILVKVLGQVEVLGTAIQITKVRQLESIIYISLHPKGVDKTIWATAIWPDQLLTRDSLNTTIWQIRRSLGTAADGSKYMPPSYNGVLKFTSAVYTDYEIFRNLSKSREESDWEKAMSLVTGRAFEGLNEPNWITLEGYLSDIESRIVDTCVQLVFKKSKSRDYDVVIWALRRALLAVPYDERLWRYLLITYSKSNNLSKLETVMNEISFAMEDDSEVYTGISDETLRLYRHLSGKDFRRKRLRKKTEDY